MSGVYCCALCAESAEFGWLNELAVSIRVSETGWI